MVLRSGYLGHNMEVSRGEGVGGYWYTPSTKPLSGVRDAR